MLYLKDSPVRSALPGRSDKICITETQISFRMVGFLRGIATALLEPTANWCLALFYMLESKGASGTRKYAPQD